MHALSLIPAFLLFFLLGGQVLLVPSQAPAADCCGCNGSCKPWCICPGTYPCAYCRTGDSDTFQAKAQTGDRTLEAEAVPQSLLSTGVNSNITERFMEAMRGGKRVLGNLNLKLLANIQDSLKFVCPGSGENIQYKTLVFNLGFRINGDKEE